jgi:hypothetical protein
VANEKATVREIPVYMGFFVVIALLIFFPPSVRCGSPG